ncbi:hypothetical protein SAMN05421780_104157 [Flexibacter flexilis DSM 6793]|uniref:Phospholipid-binding protein, PBP family n=1 Tax=Flexibacter flexilis DSM 6793 TaxID=927664 RepID=A0A1I1HZW0_9BACT|nr:YbhB/YbcL family Raf kinase inhibitor-like protein [Flexibacter flexilis]SFC29617.1 hypothetical protein SAMN05421780_104157 [Flexibacter flexilis DSM 6793]
MKKVSLLLVMWLMSYAVQAQTFTLKSDDLGGQATDKQVFNSFGCTGKNMSPQLSWSNAPQGTKSFAITVYDPDAPTGSGWWHWVVFDLPATLSSLPSGAGTPDKKHLPASAIQGITDFGTSGYGGPCPPEGHGFHRYIVTVYALKIEKLGLSSSASPAMVGYYLNANTIEKASLIFHYKR